MTAQPLSLQAMRVRAEQEAREQLCTEFFPSALPISPRNVVLSPEIPRSSTAEAVGGHQHLCCSRNQSLSEHLLAKERLGLNGTAWVICTAEYWHFRVFNVIIHRKVTPLFINPVYKPHKCSRKPFWHGSEFSQSSSLKHVNIVLKECQRVTYIWSVPCWKGGKIVSKQVEYGNGSYKEELCTWKPHPLLNSLLQQPRRWKCTKCTDPSMDQKFGLICATLAGFFTVHTAATMEPVVAWFYCEPTFTVFLETNLSSQASNYQ